MTNDAVIELIVSQVKEYAENQAEEEYKRKVIEYRKLIGEQKKTDKSAKDPVKAI